jgi:hypothetical protein
MVTAIGAVDRPAACVEVKDPLTRTSTTNADAATNAGKRFNR